MVEPGRLCFECQLDDLRFHRGWQRLDPSGAGLVFLDAGKPLLGISLPPAANFSGILSKADGDFLILQALRGKQDDPGPLFQPLGGAPSPAGSHNEFQAFRVTQHNHWSDSHDAVTMDSTNSLARL